MLYQMFFLIKCIEFHCSARSSQITQINRKLCFLNIVLHILKTRHSTNMLIEKNIHDEKNSEQPEIMNHVEKE